MKRLPKDKLISYARCPDCGGDLVSVNGSIVCQSCPENFPFYRDRPVLLSNNNELFHPSEYTRDNNPSPMGGHVSRIIKQLIPSKSINLARKRIFNVLSEKHEQKKIVILVIGCGNQTEEFEYHFPSPKTTFILCDVDKNSDSDIFCDSHQLPFDDKAFDGVISTAVLEHVIYPEKVMEEIYRVLINGGFIYSEIPFLQSVHEGAYDFSRYTMSGHRRLMEWFVEVDAGMIAGPGTVCLWSIENLFKSISNNRKLSDTLALTARILFFWIKYFDFFCADRPSALDAASCTFFLGKKSAFKLSGSEIISRYTEAKLDHL